MHVRIIKANDELSRLLCEDLDSYGSPGEGNRKMNNANRKLIQAYIDVYGSAWVGRINLYDEWRKLGRPIMREIKEGTWVREFSCDFVLPKYNGELERLIRVRDDAHQLDYKGTEWDLGLIEPIKTMLYALDGLDLIWT